jgi:hypothetical protein
MSTTIVKFQFRRDTSVNWGNSTVPLQEGEPGFDTTNKILKIGPPGGALWSNISNDNTFYPRQYNKIDVQSGVYPIINDSFPTNLYATITPGTRASTFNIIGSSSTKTLTVPTMNPGETWRVDCQCSCSFSYDAATTSNNAFLSLTTSSNIFAVDIWQEAGPNINPGPNSNINSIVRPGFAVINLPADITPDKIPNGVVAAYAGMTTDPGTVTLNITSLLFTRLS